MDARRWTYDEVCVEYQKYGYSLLSGAYKNNRERLSILCPKGHTFKGAFANFLNGSRCTICAGNLPVDIGQVREFLRLQNLGYDIVSGECLNNRSTLQLKCPKDHEFSSYWNKIIQGNGCPICRGGVVLGLDQFRVDIERTGYKLLSNTNDYKNQHSQLMWLCPQGHQVNISQRAYRRGKLCSICTSKRYFK